MKISSVRPRACVRACVVMSLAFSPTLAAGEQVAPMVQQRVRDWQPTKQERLLDQVGWAGDLVEARLDQAASHGPDGCFRAIRRAQLAQDVLNVIFDGRNADVQ